MKLNCKGFVLLETMIVAVFVVGIFTFLYSSTVPLLGTYEDSIVKSNVDVVYKLYHLKDYLHTSNNFNKAVTNNYGSITCDSFSDKTYCNNLIDFLELDNGYELVYVKNITSDKQNIVNLAKSEHLKKYINNFNDDYKSVLFLYDNNTEAVTHLYLNRLMCDDNKLSCNIINTLPLTKKDSDGTQYVYGETVNNNYVWYSGKMWRIVALNNDGTVKLVTENEITALSRFSDYTSNDYKDSQIRSWLINVFYPTLYNIDDIVVDYKWDYTLDSTADTTKPETVDFVMEKIGLLSLYDYVMTGGIPYSEHGDSFLHNGSWWWLITPKSSNSAWNVFHYANGCEYTVSMGIGHRYKPGVRPAINLVTDIKIAGGNGTEAEPYTLVGDIQDTEINDELNSRVSGEYIEFQGKICRIIETVEISGEKLTKVVMTNSVSSRPFGGSKLYTPTAGIGLYLHNWYTDLSDTNKNMIAEDGVKWYLGTLTNYSDYTLSKTGETVETPIGLRYYGELFSGNLLSTNSGFAWLITSNNYGVFAIDYDGAANTSAPGRSGSVFPVFYLKSNVKITGGTGLPNDPYTISQ